MTVAGDEDQPMGICGVVSGGCIWLISTDELFSNKKYKIQLIREGRKWVDNLLKSYKILYNVVYAENESAIKWLKSLGFQFTTYHKEYGEHNGDDRRSSFIIIIIILIIIIIIIIYKNSSP